MYVPKIHLRICLSLTPISTTAENEPLAPANTSFTLTTNSKYTSDDPGSAIAANPAAEDYLDLPEVVEAHWESRPSTPEVFEYRKVRREVGL